MVYDYQQFLKKFAVSDKKLYSLYFDMFQNEIKISNKKIAVKKLQIIITSTFKLTRNKSFSSVNLRELAKTTEISLGGLYLYFYSKEQLADQIHEFLYSIAKSIINEVENSISMEPLERSIRTYVYLTEFLKDWFFFTFLESKNMTSAQRLKAISTESYLISKINRAIVLGQENGIYKKNLNSNMISSFCIMLFTGRYLSRWKKDHSKNNIDEYSQSLVSFIKDSISVR